MADPTFTAIAQRQLRLLAQVCETLTARALAGTRSDLESLFLAQDHLEHWLQYLSPLAVDHLDSAIDAPPPLPTMRPAPPLSQAIADWSEEDDGTARPRVTFPPEPVWVEDLEREREETP